MKRESASFQTELDRWNLDGTLSIGVDEVGRGCLAGPVVAGAVVFDWSKPESIIELGKRFPIRDSKTLSRKQRQETSEAIRSVAFAVGIAEIDAAVIDDINILQATLRAMSGAVEGVGGRTSGGKALILVDGNQRIPALDFAQETVINGDATIFSIAAASIVAKEYRDALMEQFDLEFPGYDFSSHKGYGTKVHVEAIRRLGLTPIHRKTFWHG
jgi:ribonuclease HII